MAFVNSQGAEHVINWELASTPEYRQMMSKYKQIEQYMQPPFVIESSARKTRGRQRKGRAERRREGRSGKGGEEELPRRSKRKARGDGGETIAARPVRLSC